MPRIHKNHAASLKAGSGHRKEQVALPLITNRYLHNAFDLWPKVWRDKITQRDMVTQEPDPLLKPGTDGRPSGGQASRSSRSPL